MSTERDKAKQYLDDLSNGRARAPKSGVAWATRIMERIAAGEDVPMISERFAREALGLTGK